MFQFFNPLSLTHSRTEETQKNKDRMAQEALSVALSVMLNKCSLSPKFI